MAKTVVGLFSHLSEAQIAVRNLVDAGSPRGDISLVARSSNAVVPMEAADMSVAHQAPANPDYRTIEPDLTDGVVVGAESGAVVGGAAGLLLGLMTFLIPGIGPVVAAGTLGSAIAAGLTGAGTGAIAGGLLGGLVSSGIPEHHARHYEDAVREGSALVVVHAEDADAQDIAKSMYDSGAIDIEGNMDDCRFKEGRLMSHDTQAATKIGDYVVDPEDNGIAESSYTLPASQPTEGTTSVTSDRSYAEAPTILGAENITSASISPHSAENAAEKNPSIAASIDGASASLNVGHAVEASRPAGPTVSGASVDNPLTAPDILEDTNAGTTPPQTRKRAARVYDSRTTPEGNWRSSTDEVFDEETASTLEHAA